MWKKVILQYCDDKITEEEKKKNKIKIHEASSQRAFGVGRKALIVFPVRNREEFN